MNDTCLDRLLKQRSALHESGIPFAGKSESRNSYRGRRPTSDNPKQNDGRGERKQSRRRRFELFPRSDFYFVSKFELRISNLEIWCILREISHVSNSRHG